MQDIDFDALDQEVNKIINQKKQLAEQQERARRQQGKGRNMDIVKVVRASRPKTASLSRPTTASQSAVRQLSMVQSQTAAGDRPISKSISSRSHAVKNTTIDGVSRSPKTITRSKTRPSGQPAVKAAATSSGVSSQAQSRPDFDYRSLSDLRAEVDSSLKSRPVSSSPSNQRELTQSTQTMAGSLESPNLARGADLIRQRRRANSTALAVASSSADAANSTLTTDTASFMTAANKSLIKGRRQTEILSTKQADGSETVYQHDVVDYVARLAANQPNSVSATKDFKPGEVINLDNQVAAKPTLSSGVKARSTDQAMSREKDTSPFLETAKVNKRPLGVPYDRAAPDYKRATLQVADLDSDQSEATLYRGDLTNQPAKAKKWHSIFWLILMIVAIIGAAVGIYLMTVYNK